MPFLMSDAEFDETFQEYYDQFIAGYPDMAKATESMAILCDNAYRRIKDDTCPAHINITVDKSGSLDYNHSGPYVCPKAEANIGISPEERRTTLYGKSES